MANYQELLSKAVSALPEKNGAARREVYEKARKALVAQLRAISPPLPAREITQHRLELEDCIREVEHQATEELLGGLKDTGGAPVRAPTPEPVEEVTEDAIEEKLVDDDIDVQVSEPEESTETELEEEESESTPVDEIVEEVSEKTTEVELVKEAPVVQPKKDPKKVEHNAGESTTDEPEKKAAGTGSKGKPPAAKSQTAKDQNSVKPSGEKSESVVAPDSGKKKPSDVKSSDSKKATPKVDDAKPEDLQSTDQPEEPQPEVEVPPSKAIKVEAAKSKSAKKQDQNPADAETKSQANNSALDAIIARAQKAKENVVPPPAVKKAPEVKELANVEASDENSALVAAVEQAKTKESFYQPTTHSDKAMGAAMSRVREVDNVETDAEKPAEIELNGVNGPKDNSAELVADVPEAFVEDEPVSDDAQSAVDRAIQTLDREARGEGGPAKEGELQVGELRADSSVSSDDIRVSTDRDDEKSSSGLTIFLVLVILLLGAVGGGGYWAWKEGFIDLESLFTSAEPVATGTEVADGSQPVPTNNGGDIFRDVGASNNETTGPGNTATDVENVDPTDPNVALEDTDKIDDRLPTADEGSQTDTTNTDEVVVAAPNGNDEVKVEDRLGAEGDAVEPVLGSEGDVDPNNATIAGAQSLLLEASVDGASGAVPFSGTVEWSRGLDELGEPTLIGTANIPARNLNVKVLIRRNGDASLPASHLMEIDFDVSETFVGGAVAGLPGILLKNEELVQGAALVGASARVVGNSFLFALSASEQDVRKNLDLLETQKWMDLALIYASGRRAIITLEKDDAAQALFKEVLASWASASN